MRYTALYIHIPFCPYICDYCAFYTIEKANSTLRSRYLKRLGDELLRKSELCDPLETIYLGGGTPTFFSLAELDKLMMMVNRLFVRAANCEYTIECNPDSLTHEKVRVLSDGGVNRFSLGVQSFSKRIRQTIGRPGSRSRAHEAIEILRANGVINFNCDLIYGVPGQTLHEWEADLRILSDLEPPHVSTYSLTIEENTPLSSRGIQEGDQDVLASMWELANVYLCDTCGIHRYEVSNLARHGFRCKHNYSIWKGARFLGAGPSACYFDGRSRWMNPCNLKSWLRGDPPIEDYVPPQNRAVEILITGLRTSTGWGEEDFREITGFDFFALRGSTLNQFIHSGHIEYVDDTLRLTKKGLLLADYIARELL